LHMKWYSTLKYPVWLLDSLWCTESHYKLDYGRKFRFPFAYPAKEEDGCFYNAMTEQVSTHSRINYRIYIQRLYHKPTSSCMKRLKAPICLQKYSYS
jgi:hypothetical protein